MVFSLLVGLLALGMAAYLATYVLRQDSGTSEMCVIADAIHEGTEALLRRQYWTIGVMTIRLAVVMFLGYGIWSA